MTVERRREGIDVRDRLTRVEEGVKTTNSTIVEIKTMLTKHIELDVTLREAIILNTTHREAQVELNKDHDSRITKVFMSIWVVFLGFLSAIGINYFSKG